MTQILHHIDDPPRWDNPVPLLLVCGWCLARSGPAVVGIKATTAEGSWAGIHGLSRPDVAVAFEDAPGSASSGFVVRVPRPTGPSKQITFEALLADGSRQILTSVETR